MTIKDYLLSVSEYVKELNLYNYSSKEQIIDPFQLQYYIVNNIEMTMNFDEQGYKILFNNYNDNILELPRGNDKLEKERVQNWLFSFIRNSKIDKFIDDN